jgi:hypothetical protein
LLSNNPLQNTAEIRARFQRLARLFTC